MDAILKQLKLAAREFKIQNMMRDKRDCTLYTIWDVRNAAESRAQILCPL
jgi:hypothetical protein